MTTNSTISATKSNTSKANTPHTITTTSFSFLLSRVGTIARADFIMVESNATVEDATKLMILKGLNYVLVSARGEVLGIVSKTDIIFKVISQNRSPSKVHVREVMTSPVIAVSPNTTVEEALEKMEKLNIRQIFVHAFNTFIGVVSRADIYQKVEQFSLFSEDFALAGSPACIINSKIISYVKDVGKANYICPYCRSTFDTKEWLSKHMDRFHNEFDTGILEGDIRRIFE